MSKPSKCFGEIAVNNNLRMSYHNNGKVKVNVIIYQKVKSVTFLCRLVGLPVLLAQFDGSLIDQINNLHFLFIASFKLFPFHQAAQVLHR